MKTKEVFVSLSVARLAEQYGFIEPCIVCYDGSDMLVTYSTMFNPKNYNMASGSHSSAPTFEQLRKWFIDKHNIWVEVEPLSVSVSSSDKIGIRYTWEAFHLEKEGLSIVDETLLGYLELHEAYNEGFVGGFKLIEKQKLIDDIIKN